MFTETHKITNRSTRSSKNLNNLYIPKYRTNKLQSSLKYEGVKIWNDLPLKFTKNVIQTKVEITLPTILRKHGN